MSIDGIMAAAMSRITPREAFRVISSSDKLPIYWTERMKVRTVTAMRKGGAMDKYKSLSILRMTTED